MGSEWAQESPLENEIDESLREAVAGASRGSREAFEGLYRRFAPAVHGVLLARLGAADAEDLVQEVFLEAWQKLHQLREPEAFGGWVCTIARRKATDWLRRHSPAEALPPDLAATADAGPEARLALAALTRLPEAYRETLMLRLVAGMSGPEIASVTGLTPGSVRVNLHRGMRMLREQLGIDHAAE